MKITYILSLSVLFSLSVLLTNGTEDTVDAIHNTKNMDSPPLPVKSTSSDKQNSDAQEVEAIVHHCADIMSSFLDIIQKPEDPRVVGASIADMLGSMVKIVVEAVESDNLKPNSTSDEITRYINTILNDRLKTRLVSIATTERDQNSTPTTMSL